MRLTESEAIELLLWGRCENWQCIASALCASNPAACLGRDLGHTCAQFDSSDSFAGSVSKHLTAKIGAAFGRAEHHSLHISGMRVGRDYSRTCLGRTCGVSPRIVADQLHGKEIQIIARFCRLTRPSRSTRSLLRIRRCPKHFTLAYFS